MDKRAIGLWEVGTEGLHRRTVLVRNDRLGSICKYIYVKIAVWEVGYMWVTFDQEKV